MSSSHVPVSTNQILWFSYGFPMVFLWFPIVTLNSQFMLYQSYPQETKQKPVDVDPAESLRFASRRRGSDPFKNIPIIWKQLVFATQMP